MNLLIGKNITQYKIKLMRKLPVQRRSFPGMLLSRLKFRFCNARQRAFIDPLNNATA